MNTAHINPAPPNPPVGSQLVDNSETNMHQCTGDPIDTCGLVFPQKNHDGPCAKCIALKHCAEKNLSAEQLEAELEKIRVRALLTY